MATVLLTVQLKSDTSGTLPPVTQYRIGLGAASQVVPSPASGNSVEATFPNIAPGDYSAFCQNLAADNSVVGSAITIPVHVGTAPAVLVADTMTAVVTP